MKLLLALVILGVATAFPHSDEEDVLARKDLQEEKTLVAKVTEEEKVLARAADIEDEDDLARNGAIDQENYQKYVENQQRLAALKFQTSLGPFGFGFGGGLGPGQTGLGAGLQLGPIGLGASTGYGNGNLGFNANAGLGSNYLGYGNHYTQYGNQYARHIGAGLGVQLGPLGAGVSTGLGNGGLGFNANAGLGHNFASYGTPAHYSQYYAKPQVQYGPWRPIQSRRLGFGLGANLGPIGAGASAGIGYGQVGLSGGLGFGGNYANYGNKNHYQQYYAVPYRGPWFSPNKL